MLGEVLGCSSMAMLLQMRSSARTYAAIVMLAILAVVVMLLLMKPELLPLIQA